jgi:hypothetical protein
LSGVFLELIWYNILMTTTERQRQASHPDAYDWLVFPVRAFAHVVPLVEVRAPTESAALCVAEAEYPGVQFMSVVTRVLYFQ